MEYYDEVVEIKQKPDINNDKNTEPGILQISDDVDDISFSSSRKLEVGIDILIICCVTTKQFLKLKKM